MTIDTSDLLNSILGSLSRIDYIKPEEVPNIPLYMDQVTTFMDAQLASSKGRTILPGSSRQSPGRLM